MLGICVLGRVEWGNVLEVGFEGGRSRCWVGVLVFRRMVVKEGDSWLGFEWGVVRGYLGVKDFK